jgi:hypothetical protein
MIMMATEDKRVDDSRAMDLIARLMSGNEWSPDTLDQIADIVRSTGREIAEVEGDETTYEVVRFYQDPDIPNEVIKSGLSLEEAQAHCNDPETSSSTATSPAARQLTIDAGPWFDGYREE